MKLSKNQKRNAIVIAATLGFAMIALWVTKSLAAKNNSTSPVDGGGGSWDVSCVRFPLKQGSGYSPNTCEQPAVIAVQQWCNVGAPLIKRISEDGMFGPKTEARVFELTGKLTVSRDEYEDMLDDLEML